MPASDQIIQLTYGGETRTLSGWSAVTDIPYATLRVRYRSGRLTPGQILDYEDRPRKTTKRTRTMDEAHILEYRGVTHSFPEWSALRGINISTLHYRKSRQWQPGQILGYDPPPGTSEPVIRLSYGGETKTLSEWSALTGIAHSTLRERYHRRWPPVQILGYEKRARKYSRASHGVKRLTYGGETRTMREWSELRGINVSTMHYREEMGWEAGQILNYEERPRKPAITVTYRGETHTLREWSKLLRRNSSSMHSRYIAGSQAGYTPAQILGEEPIPAVRSREPKVYTRSDGRSGTIKQWEFWLETPAATLYARMRRGWSRDAALGLADPPYSPMARRGPSAVLRLQGSHTAA